MELKFTKKTKDAIAPSKNHESDAGFDLHLVKLLKVNNGVYYYDTGISVELPEGFYTKVFARSSLAKTGWMVANNVGIIDNGYRGTIIVALVRTNNDEFKELELPFKAVQLIPEKQYNFKLKEVVELTDTERMDKGGLGSRQFTMDDCKNMTTNEVIKLYSEIADESRLGWHRKHWRGWDEKRGLFISPNGGLYNGEVEIIWDVFPKRSWHKNWD